MTRARGPVWHQKQKKQGILPKGLHGLDRQATWYFSKLDGWIYGHGLFCVTTHAIPLLGLWMPNSAHEAKCGARDSALCGTLENRVHGQQSR